MERTEARDLLAKLMARAFREASADAATALAEQRGVGEGPRPRLQAARAEGAIRRGPPNPGRAMNTARQLCCRRHAGNSSMPPTQPLPDAHPRGPPRSQEDGAEPRRQPLPPHL